MGGYIASFGDVCWQTDAALSEVITHEDGRGYHPESIARSRRKLRDANVISSVRIFVNGKIPSIHAKWRSARGTTVKSFNWRALEQKNPFSRRERRLHRQEQARTAREAGEFAKPTAKPPAPRHVSARAIVDPVQHRPVPLDPELARLAEQAQQAQATWAERRAAAPVTRDGMRNSVPERPPPE